MKCHYEILDIAREADLAEIKSAYRKCALKWHPDKNLTNTEFAKEQFQLVQQAYEVLSDPQERAWYDKHREQILRGASSEFQDNSLDVFQYFTTTCFKGYGDDGKGFYTVYRNVFDQIIKEDMEFMEDKNEFCEIPRFGTSKSDYDEVVGLFYSYWSSYCTKKSYVWLDPYDIKETRDRRVLKLIEKENKKVRQKAKKERNEEIRNLVAFVRKRDKRVQEHTKLINAKILENRQKQEEISKQKRLERKKQLNESGMQAEWAKFDNVKSELEEIEKNLAEQFGDDFSNSEEESEEIDTTLYCIACNKIFKTSKALENHELSKKHKENVEKLKDLMLDEEEEEEIEEVAATEDILQDNNLSENDKESDSSIETTKKRKKKNKKAKNILTVNNEEEGNCDLHDTAKIEDSDDNFDFEATKKQKKKNTKKNKNKSTTEQKEEENENITETVNIKNNKKKQNKKERESKKRRN
ncbi:DnaJ and/or zf-C2H2 jaz domain containing protein [Asbolus verrucosus]|uniref:DnaJ homolog subfamily C member 21 n=1 Tax=Asbolus verrucosus TaxID=1661398 RepID=A0A482V8Q0_ASBVE|nr:DnaJ and/or zf-C2H2 jaz domain containing protein [Asbolus verrucosus]